MQGYQMHLRMSSIQRRFAHIWKADFVKTQPSLHLDLLDNHQSWAGSISNEVCQRQLRNADPL